MAKSKRKQQLNKRRHEFLLTLFPDDKKEYCEYELNGYWLIRQFNANNGSWEVAIYSQDSYKRKKDYKREYDREHQLSLGS